MFLQDVDLDTICRKIFATEKFLKHFQNGGSEMFASKFREGDYTALTTKGFSDQYLEQ